MFKRNDKQPSSFTQTSEALTRVSQDSDTPPRAGFKEMLKQRILVARHQKISMPTFTFHHRIPKKLAATGLITLVAVIILMLVLSPFSGSIPVVYAQDNFTLTPEQEDTLGVDPSTSFILESKEPLDLDFLREYLTIDVEISFEIKQLDEYKARITFAQALDSGQMVKFLLPTQTELNDGSFKDRPYAWAFQVKQSFSVLYSIPGTETAQVPLDAGIEVMFSHENVSIQAFEQAISLSPAVTGHVEKKRRSLVFVPDRLEPATVYTVRISRDLHPEGSSETLGQEYAFQFETSDTVYRSSRLRFFKSSINTIPTEKPQFRLALEGVYAQNQQPIDQVNFTMYRFPTFETFKQSFEASLTETWRESRAISSYVDVKTLSTMGTFKPQPLDDGYYPLYEVPLELEEGYYGVLATFQGQEKFVFVQVTTITATLMEAEGESLVWAHDVKTKSVLTGATIQAGSQSATTDTSGIARIRLPEDYPFLEVRTGNRAVLLPRERGAQVSHGMVGWWPYDQTHVDEDYIGYLYTDRPVYKQGDRVYLWGFLQNRQQQSISTQATLKLTTQLYGYQTADGWAEVEYVSIPVTLEKNGIFSAEVIMPMATSGYYTLSVELAGEEVMFKRIQLQEYRKPVYFLELDVEEKAIIQNEQAHYTVRAKYFDGTPVTGKQVTLEASGYPPVILTLDDNGTVSGEVAVGSSYGTGGYVQVKMSEPGFEPTSIYNYLTVYDANISLKGQAEVKDQVGTIEIQSKTVKITNSDNRADDVQTIRPGTQVQVAVTEQYYEKIPMEKTYDFIRKTVQDEYRYEFRKDIIEQTSVVTDQEGNAVALFTPIRPDAWHQIILTSIDDQERETATIISPRITSDYHGSNWDTTNALHVAIKNMDADGDDTKTHFKEGELVNIQVEQNGKRFDMLPQSQFLFVQAQRGIQSYNLSNVPEYDFTFEAKQIPNVYVFATLFTGSGYVVADSYSAWAIGKYVAFDTNARALQVDIETDATSYRPGGDMEINVRVKDQQGNPVASDVNVSVVDEAFFAVYEDSPDPLSILYHAVTSGIHQIISSHEAGLADTGAEGGGGGGGEARSNFVDTAAFLTLKTNKQGEATGKVKLPDNVTSWRVTVHAIDATDIQAGVNTKTVAATLPFFITTSIQSTYLTQDEPSIIVAAQGTGVKPSQSVQYTISIKETDYSYSTQTQVGQLAHLPLPILQEGEQTIVIEAKAGEYKDAIAQKVRVLPSRLTIPVVNETVLEDQTPLSGSDTGLTWVTFMDANQGKFYRNLLFLSWRYGDRADEAMVRNMATELLNETFQEDRYVPEIDTEAYQFSDGVRLLSYADSDPVLSAKIALFGETPFDEQRLRAYLMSRLYVEELEELNLEQAAWAYAGLAGLQTPVLAELKRFAEQPLSQEAQLAVAVGYLVAGDMERARALYQSIMKEAQRELGYVWIETETEEQTKETVAVLYVLAAAFNEGDDREGLRNYLDHQATGAALVLLEELLATKYALQFLKPGESEVTFSLRGETRKETLEKGETLTVGVSHEELLELNAQATKGDISVMTAFQQPIATWPQINPKMSVARRYLNQQKTSVSTIAADDIVLVEITYQIDPSLPDEFFEITESLPSGLTPITTRGGFAPYASCISYPETDTDQTLSFMVYSGFTYAHCPPNTIRYYARVMNSGTFKAEPVSIRAMKDPSHINYSNAQTLTIAP